ncbi:hypothetical protein F2P81_003777 [Scophthalmus maximus]|uniref:Uncharacterized protein n=1 Tax=Scophthalmus maximus TaxID=52904 RepID=A0A6A4TIE8_SCOMX|nr:hypothetical protein F2P81_003777 [Scophthalmus maximus]
MIDVCAAPVFQPASECRLTVTSRIYTDTVFRLVEIQAATLHTKQRLTGFVSVGASVFLSWVHKTDGIKEHSPQLRPLLQYGMRRPNPFFKCSALLTCLDFAIHSSLADYKPYTSCFQMEANDRIENFISIFRQDASPRLIFMYDVRNFVIIFCQLAICGRRQVTRATQKTLRFSSESGTRRMTSVAAVEPTVNDVQKHGGAVRGAAYTANAQHRGVNLLNGPS